jgi:ribosomal protein S27AE
MQWSNKYFFINLDSTKRVECPYCGQSAFLAQNGKNCLHVRVTSNDEKIVISQTAEDCTTLFMPGYKKNHWANLKLPVIIEISFNHASRKTYLSIRSENTTEEIDITEDSGITEGLLIKNQIRVNPKLRNLLVKIFEDINGNKICSFEITLEKLIEHNRFKGFPQNFYNAIPFCEGSKKIHDSFTNICEKLSSYYDVEKIYQKYGLPNKKSIRKTIFENPQLVFYTDVIVNLPFKNHDVLFNILNSHFAYRFLAEIRSNNDLNVFIKKMIEERGEAQTWKYYCKNPNKFMYEAGFFRIVTSFGEKECTVREVRKGIKQLRGNNHIPFNVFVPLSEKNKAMESRIGQFDFIRLKSSEEYNEASRIFRNCLRDYWLYYCQSDVYGIFEKDELVGVAEVQGGNVMQTQFNTKDPQEPIFKAFEKWIVINNLKKEYD